VSDPFAPFERKLRATGAPAQAIESFRHYYAELRAGQTGLLSRREIGPVEDVPSAGDLGRWRAAGAAALDRSVVLKLNGGLGTSMGMTRAKSLLPVRDGHTFLDVIARQVLHLRRAHRARLPLVLMNSFRTRDDSLAALARHPELASDVPADFLQNAVPKIRADDLSPVEWPADPEHEWCPPGHGDLYVALQTSGMLEALLAAGYRYAFVSNADNLGAVPDVGILGWLSEEEIPFLMEVCPRSEAHKKGGHLAARRGGGLALRESAQCPDDEKDEFQDVARYRYFNTNNLWLDLAALRAALAARGGLLRLPMIRNVKTVDPTDPASPKVIQLETAMGAAIESFPGARAVCVPEARFAPVKTTGDLLAVWSDAYALREDWTLASARDPALGALVVDLDPAFYQRIDQLETRFPCGAPSLVRCRRLALRGDVRFGRGVVVEGEVSLRAPGPEPLWIADGARLA
jgi:UTP--glucose-1-phosphate uridylyltransferase